MNWKMRLKCFETLATTGKDRAVEVEAEQDTIKTANTAITISDSAHDVSLKNVFSLANGKIRKTRSGRHNSG